MHEKLQLVGIWHCAHRPNCNTVPAWACASGVALFVAMPSQSVVIVAVAGMFVVGMCAVAFHQQSSCPTQPSQLRLRQSSPPASSDSSSGAAVAGDAGDAGDAFDVAGFEQSGASVPHTTSGASEALFVTPHPRYTDNGAQAQARAQQAVFDLGKDSDGWIPLTPGVADAGAMLQLAKDIQQHPVTCKRLKASKDGESVQACGWADEAVSGLFLKDFRWEKKLWRWIPQMFAEASLSAQQQGLRLRSQCGEIPGFLDLGVNVGDWMTPLRLLLPPAVPMYGVEGLASNAALAGSNIANACAAVSARLAKQRKGDGQLGATMLLPYALSSPPLLAKIAHQGGACFSTRALDNLGAQGMFNDAKVVGKRGGKYADLCPPQALAGVTTLDNALRGVACDGAAWPSLLVAKFDIEGAELLALTTAVPWLASQPPCYVVIETRAEPNSMGALVLLWSQGYDSIWIPKKIKNGTPRTTKPLVQTRDTAVMLDKVHALKQHGYERKHKNSGLEHDLIVGFSDLDACVARLVAAAP